MELSDFFRGFRPWSQLSRLLEQLPWYSNFRRAVQDSPEMAEAYARTIVELPDEDDKGIPMSSWDQLEELKAFMADLVNSQTVALVSAQIPKGKKRPKFRPARRPKTAMSKAIRKRISELESNLEHQILRSIGR